MHDIVQKAYDQQHQFGGKPPKLSPSDKLLLTLQYYREYRTMEHIKSQILADEKTRLIYDVDEAKGREAFML